MVIQSDISFILVHGTWAKQATWIEASSPFSQKLLAASQNSQVIPFRWSGSNSEKARRTAGLALADKIEKLASSRPHTEIVIVGHSHGGNVGFFACEALQKKTISVRLVCLGTPFVRYFSVDLTPAANLISAGLVSLIAGFFLLAMFSDLWKWTSSVVGSFPDRGTDELTGLPADNPQEEEEFGARFLLSMFLTIGLFYLSTAMLLLAFFVSFPLQKLLSWLQKSWLNDKSNTYASPSSVLAVYTSVDEAWRWLDFIDRALRPIFRALTIVGQYITKALLVVLCTSGAIWAAGEAGMSSLSLEISVSALAGLFHLVNVSAFLLLIPVNFVGSLVSGSWLGFGSASLLGFQIVGATVSQLPRLNGATLSAAHVSFRVPENSSLAHSQFYNDDAVADVIVRWLGGTEFPAPSVIAPINGAAALPSSSHQWRFVLLGMAILYAVWAYSIYHF